MLRILIACIAPIFLAAVAGANEMKPKFGDIDGVYYTDVAGDREACHQAVRNKIALCRDNTSFVSNTDDRKYPGCLPIFEDQAKTCVDHFRSEAYKCDGSGSARIEDFTGFACMVTETVVEGGSDDTVEHDAPPVVDAEGQAVPDAIDPEEATADPDHRDSESSEEERRNQAALAAVQQQCQSISERWSGLNDERWACVEREQQRTESQPIAMRECFSQYDQIMRGVLREGLDTCCGPVPGSSSPDHRDVACGFWKHIETLWDG